MNYDEFYRRERSGKCNIVHAHSMVNIIILYYTHSIFITTTGSRGKKPITTSRDTAQITLR